MSCCREASKRRAKDDQMQGVQVAALTGAESCSEFFITATGADAAFLFRNVQEAVCDLGARVVSMEVFGLPGKDAETLRDAFGDVSWPVTWVEEGCEHPNPLCGLQLWAVRGPRVEPVHVDGRVVGSTFEADGVRTCRLGGLVPADASLSRAEQTRAVFELMRTALRAAGMDFSHVVRTWFYNHEMLDWYGEFNKVRTAFFKEHRVFDGLVPASTGIGGRNAAGAALTAGLLAVKAMDGVTKAVAVPSPLQCPALDYGSSFSRAVELETPGLRRLFVSGTASIAPDGRSVHIGDMDAQVALTMDVAHAILESRGMDWGDVTRAIAYFKHSKDVPAFRRWCGARGIDGMSVLLTNNEICRDDLLFEIEVDAVAKTSQPSGK